MRVASVVEGSQAEAHGLSRGWELLRIDSTPIAGLTESELIERLADRPYTLYMAPPSPVVPFRFDERPTGLRLSIQSNDEADDDGMPAEEGLGAVLVDDVVDGSQAMQLGLAAGWELIAIDDTAVTDKDEMTLMALLASRPATFSFRPPAEKRTTSSMGIAGARQKESEEVTGSAVARELHFLSPDVDLDRLQGIATRLRALASRCTVEKKFNHHIIQAAEARAASAQEEAQVSSEKLHEVAARLSVAAARLADRPSCSGVADISSSSSPMPFSFDTSPTGLQLTWEDEDGVVYVRSVTPGGQAETLGLEPDWILIRIGDKPVAGLDEEGLMEAIADRPATLWFLRPSSPSGNSAWRPPGVGAGINPQASQTAGFMEDCAPVAFFMPAAVEVERLNAVSSRLSAAADRLAVSSHRDLKVGSNSEVHSPAAPIPFASPAAIPDHGHDQGADTPITQSAITLTPGPSASEAALSTLAAQEATKAAEAATAAAVRLEATADRLAGLLENVGADRLAGLLENVTRLLDQQQSPQSASKA